MSQKKTASSSFFSAKQIIILTVSVVFAVGVFAFTFSRVNWAALINNLSSSLVEELAAWLFTVLILFSFVKLFYYLPSYWIRFKELKITCSTWEWINFSIICMFIVCITPTSAGCEPYVLYFLKKKGLPTNQASALVFSNGFFTQTILFFLSMPVFIYLLTQLDVIFAIGNSPEGVFINPITAFFLIIGGMSIMLLVLLFYFGLCFSKRTHYYMSRIWNRVKMLLRLDYHTKEETKKTYLQEGKLRWYFISFVKMKKGTIFIITFTLLYNVLQFYCVNLSFMVLNNDLYNQATSWWVVWISADLAVAANSYIPMPGGEGTLQLILMSLIYVFNGEISMLDPSFQALTGLSISLWRSATFYLPTFLSTFGFFAICIFGAIRSKNRKEKNMIKLKVNGKKVSFDNPLI